MEYYHLAIDDFTKFINGDLNNNLQTDLFDALYYRGLSYFKLETFLNAKYDFNRLIIENKNTEPALLSSYYRMIGVCKENIFEECCSDYKTCCELGDEDCCEWLTLDPCIGVHVTTNTFSGKKNDLRIGKELYGGIVFYLDKTGEHGLVAAIEDLPGTYRWGCYKEHVDGNLEDSEIGTGYQNTKDIVSQGCATENGGISAAQAALDYESEGYSDWYLPSDNELLEMYISIGPGASQGNIGGFMYQYYLSSTGFDSYTATGINFDDGEWGILFRNSAIQVRVIRAF